MAFHEDLGYAVVGVGSDGVSIDWSDTVAAIQRMDPKNAKKIVRKVLREAGKMIRVPVQQEIKRLFPGGKHYPRDPNRKPGMFRGQKRDPLYKAAHVYIYKNSHGLNVNIFPPKKKKNVGLVLAEWLEAGTDERGHVRSTYKSVTLKGGHKSKHRYFTNYNGQYRGRITPGNYFRPVADEALGRAATYSEEAFQRNLVEQFNRK